ncbi:MAG: DUF1501 domain-containing protein [Limisphaerales bacterium]
MKKYGCNQVDWATSRRDFLAKTGAGFGAVALSSLLADRPLRAASAVSAMMPKIAHYPTQAKSVIFLFMEGGPSHLDTFDPKESLKKHAGKSLPPSFTKGLITAMGEYDSPIFPDKRQWKQWGQSGLWISDWCKHVAESADDIAVLRSCWANGIVHSNGVCQMNTGSILAGRPSLGAWVSYGLGTLNQNLPAFVVMQDNNGTVVNGPRNWGSGFMPAVYQGTRILPGNEPIANLNTPEGVSDEQQRGKLDLLAALNRQHADARSQQTELDARIAAYELAFRMQAEAPDAVDLSKETEAPKKLYGVDDPVAAPFGRMCLLSRRLVERGVRFVQLYSGAGSKWDAHSGIEKNHGDRFHETDQPIAGLLKDLKSRGLLDSTLVIWGGEFGRTPMSEKGNGRDHNPTGFTMWMAGGGVKGGQVIGATDEFGLHAVEDRLHVHDLHATILHLLGINHENLVFSYKGRPERATMNEGEIYRKITG